jgi:hypothetical protein
MLLDGLLNCLAKLVVLAEQKFCRSPNLLDKMAHAARFVGYFSEVERFGTKMENVAELEFGLPASIENVLRIEVKEASPLAAFDVVLALM